LIVNVLRFSFKDGTTEEQKAEVLAAMRRTASVESTSFGVVGRDVGDPADGYTHAFLAGVEDLAALERYMYDPVHLNGDYEILPRFADDPDPELGAKIGAIAAGKIAKYPDWGRLLAAIPDVKVMS